MEVMNGMTIVKPLRITRMKENIKTTRIFIQDKEMKAIEELMKNTGAPKEMEGDFHGVNKGSKQ
jgi:hypothetical protein